MLNLRPILVGILIYAVSTVWVRERWALGALEAAVFLCASWVALRVACRKQPAAAGLLPLALAGMGGWGLLQLAARWTVVPAATVEAVLYWLAAACLVWLGNQACATRERRQSFLKAALIAGSVVCLLGVIQLFTSDGRVFWLFASGYDSEVIGPFVYRNNFAAFVELLLPVALVLAFKDWRNSRAYLIVAAALVASVIAAASRAGATIVIAELALAFVLRPRTEKEAVQRRWITFALLASAFTLIVGYQYLWDRLSNDNDPYGIRREFVESSLAMVHAQPLHGFGLGAWPAAYRQFAIIDTGLVANHAHNEWAQWAAEGGLPAFILMLAVLALCLPAAVRSVWGIGVIAVFLHSLLDYPFMRLGLAAWIFVFIGALAAYSRERRSLEHGNAAPERLPGAAMRILAAALVPVLWFGIFQTAKLAWADTLYRRATPESVARAAEIWPHQAEYHFALAQTDPDRAVPHLTRALALNPYHTKARIALATEAEQRGDLAAGEAMLLEAARRDKQYAPAWAAANFYFRNDQPERFWQWARRAAEMSYGSLGSLFDLCFLLTNDAQTVLDRVVVPRRLVEREYLAYLIDHERLADAHLAALRIAPTGSDGDREILLNYVDRTLAASRFTNALEIWNQLCRRRLVPYPAAAAGTLVNGDFAQPILNRAFDWRLAAIDGAVAAQARAGGPGLDVAFSGKQPENCEIMSHFVPLAKGATYILRFQYRTDDLPEETGLLWSVGAGPQRELAASQEWSAQQWQFQAPDDAARLVLEYRRRLGTTRIEGTLRIRQVQLTQETL